jgi:streptogramin lyase
MSKDQELFERAIDAEFERQSGSMRPSTMLPRQVVARGRRRRVGKVMGSMGLVVAVGIAGFAVAGSVTSEADRIGVAEAAVIGAEQIVEFGGPLAASTDALYVANGRLSNDAGDKVSVARYDLATGEVTETDPAIATPLNVALGREGLWTVGWNGDMPVGDGGRVRGQIQLVDPDSGEVLIDIPREDSAPYDVAVGEVDGREYAWVADAGLDQILRVDPETGEIEAIQLDSSPTAIAVGGGAVWATSNERGNTGVLTRYDLADSSLGTMNLDFCMNDVAVIGTSLWASDYCNGEVHRFDPVTASANPRLVMPSVTQGPSVSVGGNPRALGVADGLLWVATGSEIVRVDPERNEVVGEPTVIRDEVQYLMSSGDTVFASSFTGVYRLGEGLPVRDPAPVPTPEEKQKVAIGTCEIEQVMCVPLDREWSVVGAGFGSAWVGNIGEGKTFGIARFDATSGEQSASLPLDGFVQDFAADDRWMWVLLDKSDQLELLRIDPATNEVTATYDLGGAGNIGEPSMIAAGGYVWVSGPEGLVQRVDAAGGVVSRSLADELPGYGGSNGPVYLAYGDDSLWLSYGKGHVGVVDPATLELVGVENDALGINAYEIVYADGQLWAPHQTGSGKNVLTYVSTEGDQAYKGTVSLLDAPPGSAATDGSQIWVLQQGFEDRPGWLVEVDPGTHGVVGKPLEVDLGFQGGVAVGDGYVWVTGNMVLYRVAID